ncbi:MAG: deoxyguanosinetriphosphate triphosphohydrolase [Alphaproteobacteria bacterium]|nr:deoxyguanosinetriphosphate triphosphohydrolase [Alphaproteobacteria bacterium]
MNAKRASYSTFAEDSPGRFYREAESLERPLFQRDRDRVVHSTALRRLKHKTQVFVSHEGDHYRTRLTHSLEVAQIARSISRMLGLEEDLVEALALAHDLGHTPFGHAGEEALDACMKPWGGFDHNAQTLRIVTRLERRYADFDGLNLSWESLEGLLKHNGPAIDADDRAARTVAAEGLPAGYKDFEHFEDLKPTLYASAEAQVASIADDIAYNAHDIDDGLRAGLFDVIDLADVPLAGTALNTVLSSYQNLERSRMVHETVRRVISAMVGDVVKETRKRVTRAKIKTADDVRQLGKPLVGFSPQLAENNRVLQLFLSRRMYKHERVRDIMGRAQRVVTQLFEAYMTDQEALPESWRLNSELEQSALKARHISDFIAGMTDRYALEEHKRLFDLDRLFS